VLSADFAEQASFRRGAGCKDCLQTGFAGRTALTEMLVVNEVFRDAVLQKLPTRTLQEVAVQQGMHTLWQNGLRRVTDGQTPLEEIFRVVAIDRFQNEMANGQALSYKQGGACR
jgi:type II secretory ATPase GspE/PulE/Tfp pilus assembly ATPase PilB-like protein